MPINKYHIPIEELIDLNLAPNSVGTAELKDGNVTLPKLATNAIYFRTYLVSLENQKGLSATTTGVKVTGATFRLYKSQLKSLKLRASWTASATDSVTAIELYDITAGAVRASVSGNKGTDVETTVNLANLVDGNLHCLRVNVTTASATAGATTDCLYAILEFEYGFS